MPLHSVQPKEIGHKYMNVSDDLKKVFVSLDFGDNPIYPISNPDGQDQEVYFLGEFAIVGYGHFPTRNGLKLRI